MHETLKPLATNASSRQARLHRHVRKLHCSRSVASSSNPRSLSSFSSRVISPSNGMGHLRDLDALHFIEDRGDRGEVVAAVIEKRNHVLGARGAIAAPHLLRFLVPHPLDGARERMPRAHVRPRRIAIADRDLIEAEEAMLLPPRS